MKCTLISLLLILVLLAACSGQAADRAPAPASLPTLTSTPAAESGLSIIPSQNAPFAPALTPESTPPAAENPAPSQTPFSTPTLPRGEGSPPQPECSAVFIPAGFTADGKSLVGYAQGVTASGMALQLLDVNTLAAKTVAETDAYITAAALSPDGQTFAWALPDFTIQLFHLPDGKNPATLTGHSGAIFALLFSPDGSRLYSTSADGSIIVWDTAGQARQSTFQPFFLDDNVPGEVQGLGISPDGKTLITIPTYGSPRAWDTVTFKQVVEYRSDMVAGYTSARAGYSPDGKYLAIGFASGPGDITLWRAADTQPLWSGGMMAVFAFSPDGRLFAHTGQDVDNRSHIVIRSADGQTVVQTIPALSDAQIMQLLFSPDSRTLVWMDSTVLRFWDIASQRLLKTYAPPCR